MLLLQHSLRRSAASCMRRQAIVAAEADGLRLPDDEGAPYHAGTRSHTSAISLHDALILEDDTPYVVNEDRTRWLPRSADAWLQQALGVSATDTATSKSADNCYVAPNSLNRIELIQQTSSVTALMSVVDNLGGLADHKDISSAISHLLKLSSPVALTDGALDDQAATSLHRLHMLLQSPMVNDAAAPAAPSRLSRLQVPEVALLLSALINGPSARTRSDLVRDLLHHLLAAADGVGPQALLHGAAPGDVARLAEAVSRLAGRMESASSDDLASPHHHLQCALQVRHAFSAIATTALRQLQACAASPASCGWDVEELSNLVTSLARLDHYNEPLMNAIASTAVMPGLMSTTSPASLALLLSGFARMRHDAPELFRHAALHMRTCMHKLRPKDLAVAIHSFESRHMSSVRWRNRPTDSAEGCSLASAIADAATARQASNVAAKATASAAIAATAAQSGTLASAISAASAAQTSSYHPSVRSQSPAANGVFSTARFATMGATGGVSTSPPQRHSSPVKPMLGMDSKIEPWDLMAGGARKMYLWHLLDVTAAAGAC